MDADEQVQSIASWEIPIAEGGTLQLDVRPGEVTTIVGANGAGKSALATRMAAQAPAGTLRRVLAQRKIWLQNSGSSISAARREQYSDSLSAWDRAEDSRYMDHGDAQRADIALFDFLGKVNSENQIVADLVYGGDVAPGSIEEQVGPRLISLLNRILERAGLGVEIGLGDQQSLFAIHRDLRSEYPITQMSDGERSALLLAVEVLNSPVGSIVMLDEPERHLHRSISPRLVEAVLEVRSDCGFIVLTHDLDLAASLSARPGRVFTTMGVTWRGSTPESWSIYELSPDAQITESARRAILGGRRRLLFIEGGDGSLDLPLYGALFPGWTLAPAGSCEAVVRSVSGLSVSSGHHWVQAAGIVDGDGRSEDERSRLSQGGVSVLAVSEVENLYYLTDVVAAVARKQASMQGEDVDVLLRGAKSRGLAELGKVGVLERLAKKLAKDEIARKMLSHVPAEIDEGDVTISLPSPYLATVERLRVLSQAGDYEALLCAVPIRETGFRNEVAKSLGFPSFQTYQKAALVCIVEDSGLASALRLRVASLDGVSV